MYKMGNIKHLGLPLVSAQLIKGHHIQQKDRCQHSFQHLEDCAVKWCQSRQTQTTDNWIALIFHSPTCTSWPAQEHLLEMASAYSFKKKMSLSSQSPLLYSELMAKELIWESSFGCLSILQPLKVCNTLQATASAEKIHNSLGQSYRAEIKEVKKKRLLLCGQRGEIFKALFLNVAYSTVTFCLPSQAMCRLCLGLETERVLSHRGQLQFVKPNDLLL